MHAINRYAAVKLALLWCCFVTSRAWSAPLRFGMGTPKAALWEGFTRVTPGDVYNAKAAFGWEAAKGLKAQWHAYSSMVDDSYEGSPQPPPIWTNTITEASIMGDTENAFMFDAPAGSYDLYVMCGSSDAMRGQYFDFTVQAGPQRQHVQIDGGYQFRALRFHVDKGDKPLSVRFVPRSKWVVNAIVAWTAADAADVEKKLISPLEESTFRMPSEEWAKWKADPEPPTGQTPAMSDADRARGFAVYARHYLECIYPHTQPRQEELNPSLRLFAAPGQYEPTNFVVLPLADLSDAKVAVSDVGPVPASNIDIRHVRYSLARPNYTVRYRYRVVPDMLEHFDAMALKQGENARFWLTIHVPTDAPAGTYQGHVTFQCSGGTTQIPIALRILPIALRENPDRLYGIYYHHPLDDAARAKDDVSRAYFRHKAELDFADMAAHGTRNVVLSVWTPPADAEGNFHLNLDTLAEKIALWKKFDFRGPIAMEINTDGIYTKYMKDRPGSHLRGLRLPPEAFSKELTAMVKAIEVERVKRGWPEFLYYPVDEPGVDDVAVKYMAIVLKACKDAGVRTYLTADPTLDAFVPLRPYVDVWCTQPFLPDRETILADMKARGVEYWCYPNHVNGENDHTPVTGARMTYGYGFWRSGFRTLIPWIYAADIGDPFNYLDGSSMDFFNRHEPGGQPIPVAMWEAYRSGYDDYRYIYTLEQLIAEARHVNKPAATAAADKAERRLQSIWEAIRVQPKYMYDNLWAPEQFDVSRWMIAREIMDLQDVVRRQ